MAIAVGDIENPKGAGLGFAVFDRTYRRRVQGLLRRYVPCPDRVEDLTQETLMRAFARGVHLERDRDAWPWLARVARNVATDESRRKRATEVPFHQEQDLRVSPGAYTEYLKERRNRAVAGVLDALPAGTRDALRDRYVQGMSYDEIASARSTTVGAVRSQLFRARSAFADRWREVADRDGLWALAPLAASPLLQRLRVLRGKVGTSSLARDHVASALAGATAHLASAAALASLILATPGVSEAGSNSTEQSYWGQRVAEAAGAVESRSEVASARPRDRLTNESGSTDSYDQGTTGREPRRLSLDTSTGTPGAPGTPDRPADARTGIVIPGPFEEWDFRTDGEVTVRRPDDEDGDRSGSLAVDADCTEPGDARPLAETACPLMPGG